MIQIDTILHGPELDKLPIGAAIWELIRTLNGGNGSSTKLEILLIVPGSLGGADFEGMKVTVASAKQQRVRVKVAAASELASAADPLPGLADLVRQASALARAKAPWLNVDDDLRLLDGLGDRNAGDHIPAYRELEPESELPAHSVQIHFRLSQLGDFGLFEDELIEAIETSGTGEVDGNEIGQGELVVFIDCDDPEVVRAAVTAYLDRNGLAGIEFTLTE